MFDSEEDLSFEKESDYSRGAQPRAEIRPGYLGLRCIMHELAMKLPMRAGERVQNMSCIR